MLKTLEVNNINITNKLKKSTVKQKIVSCKQIIVSPHDVCIHKVLSKVQANIFYKEMNMNQILKISGSYSQGYHIQKEQKSMKIHEKKSTLNVSKIS